MDFQIINSLLKQGNWDPEDEVVNSKSLSKLPRDPVVLIEFKIMFCFLSIFMKQKICNWNCFQNPFHLLESD